MKKQFYTVLLTLCSLVVYGQISNDASITVLDGAVLYAEVDIHNKIGSSMNINGTVALQGNFTNEGTVASDADGTVQFMGTSTSTMTPGTGNYAIVSMDKQGANLGDADVTLLGRLPIDQMLDFTDGMNTRLVIGNHNLVMASVATTLAAAATKYVVTNGTGAMQQQLDDSEATTFPNASYPVGDIDHYTPLTSDLTGTATNADASVSVNVNPMKDANLLASSTDYINRYWNVTAENVSNYSNTLVGTYVDGDIVGTETNMTGTYDDSSGDWFFTNTGADAAANTLTATTDILDTDFTGQNMNTPDLRPDITLGLNIIPEDGYRDFVVNIYESNNAPTLSKGAFRITVPGGYSISYDENATSTSVLASGTYTVANGDWNKFQVGSDILDLQMKDGVTLSGNSTNRLGFRVTRTSAISGASGNISITIYNDPTNKYDTNDYNNIYTKIISAQ